MSSFFVVEGMNGCGKSTVMEALKSWMTSLDKSCGGFTHYIKEPGELGYQFLKKKGTNDYQRMLAMFADRLQHKFMMDNTENNRYVFDRYDPSTFVYQCVLGTVDDYEFWGWKEKLEIPDPDIYFYLKIDAEVAFERASLRGLGIEHPLSMESFEKIYSGYETFFRSYNVGSKVITLDAMRHPSDIAFRIIGEIWEHVRKSTSTT